MKSVLTFGVTEVKNISGSAWERQDIVSWEPMKRLGTWSFDVHWDPAGLPTKDG